MAVRSRCLALLFLPAIAAALPAAARADCPTTPTDDLCRPWTALLLPTAFGAVYAPGDLMGTWAGGGAEVVLMAWSDNSPSFGPSQGKLRFDIGLLASDEDGAGTMVMYRGGVQVSLERNASRRFLIPYAAADLGGMWTEMTGTRGFVDAGGGLYLLHSHGLVVDLEATWLLPFSDPDQLSGLRAQLAVSAALW